ncbi:SDR family oxidoreductase [Laribacter hongkongensis]|uniref:dTDP-4-dehydrorhamnose reductase family protein n=1 Tax=Laribacter hongkongensis TaxID=168471 RepID=UPI001EFD29F5|nr:SDR family oxidoreductase [Laribacter hongkongensis]MCG9101345.1 SDR family oxidoreductase [Laribacter hongkongensis]MCG9104093.1 SDR family oxidoreductase [Laribacter hongkongensis]MCG9113431.1 SDR family oxidoreductase [Laribacter hongkongensis]MCG9118928.1 SDR family oxidoreductase [Laribacter hongkongensis]
MKVMVLGASGMLGNAMVRVLGKQPKWQVFGTLRSDGGRRYFTSTENERLISGVDVEQVDSLLKAFSQVQPQIVVNCIGLVKQLADAKDPLLALPINALLPHRLERLCELVGARLVHISTDCVFSGLRGGYTESDLPDASDLYGRSKLLGEVSGNRTITLRTSIIGHELHTQHALVEWFLAQEGRCFGHRKAIFSGMPTVVLAEIIRDFIVPREDLSGVFHVAAAPISKYDLLRLLAQAYGKQIEIIPDDTVAIDRSLNAGRFNHITGYSAPTWPAMIAKMKECR